MLLLVKCIFKPDIRLALAMKAFEFLCALRSIRSPNKFSSLSSIGVIHASLLLQDF